MTIANETIDERPVSSVFTAGRIFYLVKNVVYYSQVMEGGSVAFLSKCYQKNDPTAEQLNNILDTDGGTVPINSADRGISLKESSNGVVIFCSNGVWELSGPKSGFKATEFSLRKITDAGCISAQAIVQVEGAYYYWSENKIHQITTNQYSVLEEKSVIDNTIETYYAGITLVGKKYCYGFYNKKDNVIEWAYNNIAEATGPDILRAHTLGLNLNLKTGGWFPTQTNGKVVEDATVSETLVGGVDTTALRDDGPFFISMRQVGVATPAYTVKVGRRDDTTFQDFGSDYPTAYLETGHETLQKPSNAKSAPTLVTHFKQTEENWISDGGGGFELDLPSGCQLRAQWDWNNSDANGRFAPYQQVYRFRRAFTPVQAEPFDSGESVITTKNKIRGRGKALSLRFEQEANKDFQLLGYTIQWSIKSKM